VKTISINLDPEIVAKAVEGIRAFPFDEAVLRMLLKDTEELYLHGDLIGEEIPFKSDNFIDEDGELYPEVHIHPQRVYHTEDGHRWIEGTGVKVDLTAFFESTDAIIDEAYSAKTD